MTGGSSRGATFNGGTITNPLVIDLSADLADRTALDVIQPATFGFGVRPFRFRQTDFAYFQMETTGNVSSAGNVLASGGGAVQTANGSVTAGNGGISGASVTVLDGGTGAKTLEALVGELGFFNMTPAAQPTGVAVTAAAIHAALVTLGLITA